MAPEKSSPKFDEMLDADGRPRPHYQAYARWLADTGPAKVAEWQKEADLLFRRVGITFNVYGDTSGTERLIPFDLIPRVISADEWRLLERGLRQRVQALNAFLHDIYHAGEILKAGRVPAEKVFKHPQYRAVMRGLEVPGGVYSHIAGIDLVRDGDGRYCVLEDNLRTPSGVSYMLEDRKVIMQLFPELFGSHRIAPSGARACGACSARCLTPSGCELLRPGVRVSHAAVRCQAGFPPLSGLRSNAMHMRSSAESKGMVRWNSEDGKKARSPTLTSRTLVGQSWCCTG